MKLISLGNEEFQFACSLGTELLGLSPNSERTIRRAIKELVEHGFIVCCEFSNGSGHKPNIYRFSSNWKTWKKHKDITI